MITKKELEEMEARANAATPGPWATNCSLNAPFYIDLVKPAPSLSKHDDKRPSYWRIEDGVFVVAAREDVPRLIAYVKEMNKVLDKQAHEVFELSGENAELKAELKRLREE